jgi:signal peptidase I
MLFALIIGIFILLFFWFVRTYLLVVHIRGNSMYPTLAHGDRILVLRHYPTKRLSAGQIVICDLVNLDVYLKSKRVSKPSSGTIKKYSPLGRAKIEIPYIVKRLIGLPGFTVIVPISGVQERMRVGLQSQCDEQGNLTWHVPPNHCFIRGDGLVSVDSVVFGPIPLELVAGIMLAKFPRPSGVQAVEPPVLDFDLQDMPSKADL